MILQLKSVRHSLPLIVPNHCHHFNACALPTNVTQVCRSSILACHPDCESRTPLEPFLSLLPKTDGKFTSSVMFLKPALASYKLVNPNLLRGFVLNFSLPFNVGIHFPFCRGVWEALCCRPQVVHEVMGGCGVGPSPHSSCSHEPWPQIPPGGNPSDCPSTQHLTPHVCGAPSDP